MSIKQIEGQKLAQMFIEGAGQLSRHVKVVDLIADTPGFSSLDFAQMEGEELSEL